MASGMVSHSARLSGSFEGTLGLGLRFTLSQLGQARRGSWCEVGVTQERQAISSKQAKNPI